jgi:hypothetical protein
MCNCNQKRTQYASQSNATPKGMVKVKLITNNPMVLTGDVTGRMYAFRTLDDINWVDRRDALGMKDVEGLQILL